MDTIVEANDQFDFSKITLGQPISIQNAQYFTKLFNDQKKLYFQTPRCLTRNGIVKNVKRMFCELMFENQNEEFIKWIEHLENTCQRLIYEKSESWFENSLEMNDIESTFNSPLKIYKSGKYYLLRSNVKINSVSQLPMVKIFNENENLVTMEDIKPDTTIISIVEVQGIRFTTRNFQIEFELKQMMIVNNEEIFSNCVIKKSGNDKTGHDDKVLVPVPLKEEDKDSEEFVLEQIIESLNQENEKEKEKEKENIPSFLKQETLEEIVVLNTKQDTQEETKSSSSTTIQDTQEDGLKEFDIADLDLLSSEETNEHSGKDLETMTLKKPNQVYYEIYKIARKKAKEARKTAIEAYLEAKNIKKIYMLDDIDESSEEDEEEEKENEDMSDFADF